MRFIRGGGVAMDIHGAHYLRLFPSFSLRELSLKNGFGGDTDMVC